MSAPVPDNLAQHPRLGQWLQVLPDGRVRATSGKVDIGQGISHALRLVVAEELALPPAQVEMVPASTAYSPDEAVTSGSLSMQQSGTALRAAAAHLREACRARAAQRLGVDPAQVRLAGGRFEAAGSALTYAELVDPSLWAQTIDPRQVGPQADTPSAWGDTQRPDIAAKVFGQFTYLHDLTLPGLLHGRVHRPDTLQATLDDAAWQRLVPQLQAMDGVRAVLRDGLLVGVVTEAAHQQERPARAIAAAALWRGEAAVPAAHETVAWLQSQPLETTVVHAAVNEPPPAAPAARVLRATYSRQPLQHASIGLCCALACWHAGTAPALEVWSHTQGIFNLRRDLALAFALPAQDVTVHHAEGAGCYGHNGADDVAWDAAWLARQVPGRPVRVEWTRHQEMAHAPLGPAMAVEIEAAVDAEGRLLHWRQEVWSQGHGTRPGRGSTPSLLGAWQTATPFPVPLAVNAALAAGGGSERNAVPPYAAAAGVQVRNHRVLAMPQRVSALRALGAHVNVMAAESMVDELAHTAGCDPLAWRLAHLPDPRARAVLEAVARAADWSAAAAARPEGWGRGLGFARYKGTGAYCAVVAEIQVDDAVRLRRLHIAADLGRVVHPDGARNQIEGGALQAASWTLREAADLSAQGLQSVDWERYPILGFQDLPAIDTVLLDQPALPSLGAGECSAGPTAAAIANAIHDALGLRLRDMPFTPERLLQAVHATA